MAISNEILLQGLNSQVSYLFNNLFKAIIQKGFSIKINSVYRSFQEQQKLVDKMGKGAAAAGSSPHNYGIAVDFNITDKSNNKVYLKSTPKSEWEKTGIPALIRKSGFRWGGDFNPSGTGGYDPIHIDLANNFPTKRLRAMAIALYGNNVSDIKANQLDLKKIPNSILDKISDVIDSGDVSLGGSSVNVWPVIILGLALSLTGTVVLLKS